jgi:cell division protease FtsH
MIDHLGNLLAQYGGLLWVSAIALITFFLRRALTPREGMRPSGAGGGTPGARDPLGPRRLPPGVVGWWVVLALLMLWNLSAMLGQHPTSPVARIPYSSFISQVQADNVTQVALRGSEITGRFRNERLWVPTTGDLLPAPGEAKATGGEKAVKAAPPPEETGTAQPTSHRTNTEKVRGFVTLFPSSVGDPGLLPLLERHKVEIVAAPVPTHWLARLITGLLPTLLLVGFFLWMGRRAMRQQQSIFGPGRSQARRFDREMSPGVSFADVAGADAAKAQLQEIVEILRAPEHVRRLGARIPRGVLLVGPPGTGKTLLARAVAGEAGVPFFSISGSEFVEMFVGVGASRVRNLFKEVKQNAPAILFVDELDAVGRRRGAGVGMVNDEREQTLNQLLVEMDGFDERESVIVIAATNRPDVLDPALHRPGRFDRQVVVGLPDLQGRRGILAIHTRRLALASHVDLDALAGITMGMSGAQLANLCNEAALLAARRNQTAVTRSDFEQALDKILLGDVRVLVMDQAARRVIAYHEGGHALVAWLTPEADPVHKVTIVPRGMALGVTEQRPEEDRYNLSRPYLLARLAVMLGGRTAEEIAVGEVTTGAENDLLEATELARRMVTAWGMSELGLAAYERAGEDRFLGYDLGRDRPYSDDTARRIDGAVSKLLDERHAAVRRLLEGARARLDRLARTLLERETVEQSELERLLGPRPTAQPSPGYVVPSAMVVRTEVAR